MIESGEDEQVDDIPLHQCIRRDKRIERLKPLPLILIPSPGPLRQRDLLRLQG
jgi:hypothetical protein